MYFMFRARTIICLTEGLIDKKHIHSGINEPIGFIAVYLFGYFGQ